MVSSPFLNALNPERHWVAMGYMFIKFNPVFHLDQEGIKTLVTDIRQFRHRMNDSMAVYGDDRAKEMMKVGVKTFIFTDISKDGAMEGTNIELYRKLVEQYGDYVDIIASGGISTMDDLEKLHEIGVDGVIIGRALYNGALDLAEVMDRFAK